MQSPEREARRALVRLRRALEKAIREMGSLEAAIRHAEGEDFPAVEYAAERLRIGQVIEWVDGESARLQAKILQSGGLEPGRLRRSSEQD